MRTVPASKLSIALAAGTLAAATGLANAELVYGVTSNQFLVTFDSATPGTVQSGAALSGLQQNEQILGIDFRPATGQLYALGSTSRLYTINTNTGAASQVGPGPFANTLNGSSFGFDFNPTIDRIRVVSEADQNLVLNPDTGGSTMVTSLFYPAGDANAGVNPNVVASAYTNSFAGATTTQLYGIDSALDILVTQANSAGTLGTVGPLNTDVTDLAGFDISGSTGIAYAAVQNATLGRTTFWTVNLATGNATMVGEIGGGSLIGSIAVIPAPATGALALAGLLVATRRRR
ncbi:MAG: DUF4394 domain-containing protein [Phycisphaerales bacterium]